MNAEHSQRSSNRLSRSPRSLAVNHDSQQPTGFQQGMQSIQRSDDIRNMVQNPVAINKVKALAF